MRRRHPLPRTWLMTDERTGDGLWAALERLPRGAGVVFRHYDTPPAERRALLARVVRIARRRRLTTVLAGRFLASYPGVGGHNRRPADGLYTRSAHRRRDIIAAERAGADLVFLSPVFATRSHPGARPLGVVRFGLMTRTARVPVIALGGMTARRSRSLTRMNIHGWAGIDAWSR